MDEVEIRLNPTQFKFVYDETKFLGYIGGVRSGKTVAGALKAGARIVDSLPCIGLIAANTYPQLHESTLPEFWATLDSFGLVDGVDYVYGKQPPKEWGSAITWRIRKCLNGVITFRNGHQVVTRSLTKFKSLRGLTLAWAWIDETAGTTREALQEIQARISDETAVNQLWCTTTPDGYTWLYDFFEAEPSKDPELRKQRKYYNAATTENWRHLPDDYIPDLIASYDSRLALQFVLGQWIDVFTGRAYYAFDRDVHLYDDLKYDRRLPVYLLCDFNISPMSWLVAQRRRRGYELPHGDISRGKYQGEVLDIIDEIVINTTTTQETFSEYISRGYDIGNTVVFGDASGGWSGSTTTTLSDYQVIRDAIEQEEKQRRSMPQYRTQALKSDGISGFQIPSANPNVLDRIAAVNAKLLNARGEVGVRIHKRKCPKLKQDLLRVGFKAGTRQIDKSDKALTHASDALGYCIYRLWPVHRVKRKVIHTAGV